MQNLLFASLDFQYYWATHIDLSSFAYTFPPPNARYWVPTSLFLAFEAIFKNFSFWIFSTQSKKHLLFPALATFPLYLGSRLLASVGNE